MSARFRTIVERTDRGYAVWLLGPGVAVVGLGATAKQAYDDLRAASRSAATAGETAGCELGVPIRGKRPALSSDTIGQPTVAKAPQKQRFPIKLNPKHLRDATGREMAAILSETEFQLLLDALEDSYWSRQADEVKASGERPVRFERSARKPARAKK